MRTQEEIVARIKSPISDDFLGTHKEDLIDFLEFEHAKEFLGDEYVSKVLDGTEKYEVQQKTPAELIVDYLPFAFGKAENERSISASRSIDHMKAWLWLDESPLSEQVDNDEIEYSPYGMPILEAIAEQYNFKH